MFLKNTHDIVHIVDKKGPFNFVNNGMIVIGCFVFIIYTPNMQTSEKNVTIGIGKVEKKYHIIDKFE